jgi:solute carrier family 45 protein 1/2/4
MKKFLNFNENFTIKEATEEDNVNISKRKTRLQLILLSLIVCGIEFCYAAETAFVTPILLKIGVPIQYMTMVWCLSPFIGFITCPILGLISDSCSSKLGRRRPFIILYSFGIVIGLIFVSYGESFGKLFNFKSQSFIIFITIIGVFLLDFDCDACQSPARAYLLDVCLKEDHEAGLSMFTIMAGVGGFIGYIIAGIPWEDLLSKKYFEYNMTNVTNYKIEKFESNHIKIIFSCVLVIYVICAGLTLSSFKEINFERKSGYKELKDEDSFNDYDDEKNNFFNYFKHYFLSIFNIKRPLLLLCITNCFCWMSLICYSLYFTDFVAKEIFGKCCFFFLIVRVL